MENLNAYIKQLENTERIKRPQIAKQSNLNRAMIIRLSQMVKERTAGAKGLQIPKELNETYLQIFRYLNNDYSLEVEQKHISVQKWNLDKGLFLIGNFGLGKTLLLDLIYSNRGQLGISGRYATAFELSQYYVSDSKKFDELTSAEHSLFLDEIGDEPKETLNYGNAENVAYRGMKLFFDKVEKQGNKSRLFATSNLGQKELIGRYDERIWSRIVGNCNIIVFGAGLKDFRK